MSEARKKQKQNPSHEGKGPEITSRGSAAISPRLFGGSLQGDTLVCSFCLLTSTVVVIHGGSLQGDTLVCSFCLLTSTVVVIHGMTGAANHAIRRTVSVAALLKLTFPLFQLLFQSQALYHRETQ